MSDEKQPCAVCIGLTNDHTPKTGKFCGTCNKFICDEHLPRILDRAVVAAQEVVKKLIPSQPHFRFTEDQVKQGRRTCR